MLSMSQYPSSINGGLGGMMDNTGTINPAALNSAGVVNPANYPQANSRGLKRSRSPDISSDPIGDHGDDDNQPRKRGRPPKSKVPESPASATSSLPPSLPPTAQTPQMATQSISHVSPPQASPTKSTPTKGTAMKALPTVRDHATDQLNPEGDEYIPRTIDDAGEKKVAPNGALLGGREYRVRTFFVPKRGDKLFMLATECARVLGYRDSYLLFNKNRSLHKIIANQEEKDDLIAQEMLPYSYRSRQIAIVTAKSMFRQFGSKTVVNGRRVRDDYFEALARKQGFTEEDAAGEKRPGHTRAREAQVEANNAAILASLPQGEIIYSNGPGDSLSASALGPLPMILPPTDDLRPRDYSSVQRPRHEISGQPYQDRTQSSPMAEILGHAASTSEFNKQLGQQRTNRTQYLNDMWRRPHEPVIPSIQSTTEAESSIPVTQAFQSPQQSTGSLPGGPQAMLPPGQQAQPSLVNPQAYAQQHQQPMMAQSPNRPMHPQLQQRSPSIGGGGHPQQQGYVYPPNQMMYQQPQASPMQQAHPGYQQYPGQMAASPHGQSPMHPPPQLHHAGSSGSMHGQAMGYPNMAGINPQYANMPRNMYAPSPSPQHYMQSGAQSQPGMPGWAPGPQQQQQQSQQQQQQQQQGGWQGY